jgi:CTD kinase subunit beta
MLIAYSHRTLVGLQYPPHSVALACIYLAALLTSFEATLIPVPEGYADSRAIVGKLSTVGAWEASYKVKVT